MSKPRNIVCNGVFPGLPWRSQQYEEALTRYKGRLFLCSSVVDVRSVQYLVKRVSLCIYRAWSRQCAYWSHSHSRYRLPWRRYRSVFCYPRPPQALSTIHRHLSPASCFVTRSQGALTSLPPAWRTVSRIAIWQELVYLSPNGVQERERQKTAWYHSPWRWTSIKEASILLDKEAWAKVNHLYVHFGSPLR